MTIKNERYTWIHLLLLLVAGLVISSAGTTGHDAYTQTLPPGELGLPPPDRCHLLGAAGTPYVTGINCRLSRKASQSRRDDFRDGIPLTTGRRSVYFWIK